MDKRDRRSRITLFLAGIFIVGVTLGSIIGLGSSTEAELTDDPGFRRYLASAALTGLPFWCGIILPQTFRHRLGFGSLTLLIKGVLLGCSGVFVLSSRENGLYFYTIDILPQLLVVVPMYIFTTVRLLAEGDRPYTYPSILTNFFIALFADFLISCVQYLVFFAFYTIQGVIVTNF